MANTTRPLASTRQVLTFNEELRKYRAPFALPDQSGHVMFQMASVDYVFWTNVYPELAATDPQIAKKAWIKFLNSEQGSKYKVNHTEGRRMPTDRIVIK